MTIKEIARAKINLCLHVVGQRADGYHLLDSVVGFAEFGDVLTFEPAEQTTLTIGGPFGDGLSGEADNLILKAARCFSGGKGAAIHLEKNPLLRELGGDRRTRLRHCAGWRGCGMNRCPQWRCSWR